MQFNPHGVVIEGREQFAIDTTGYLIVGGAPPVFVRIGRDGYRIGSTAAAFAHRVA